MKIEDFTAGIVQKVAKERCSESGMLLAGIMSAGVSSVPEDCWIAIWKQSLQTIVINEKSSKKCRDNIIESGKSFIQIYPHHYETLTTVESSSVLAVELRISLLSNLSQEERNKYGNILLNDLMKSPQREDWRVLQLSLLSEMNVLPSSEDLTKLTPTIKEPINHLRLLECLHINSSTIDFEIIERCLRHQSKSTRRLGISLLTSQQFECYVKNLIPLLALLSDEQPLHLISPVWEEFIEILTTSDVVQEPSRWFTITAERAMLHADDRVVRLVSSSLLNNKTLSKFIIPSALHDIIFPAGIRCGVTCVELPVQVVANLLATVGSLFSVESTPRSVPSIRELFSYLSRNTTKDDISLSEEVLKAHSTSWASSAYNFCDQLHELSLSVLSTVDDDGSCNCDLNVVFHFMNCNSTDAIKLLCEKSLWGVLRRWVFSDDAKYENIVKIASGLNDCQLKEIIKTISNSHSDRIEESVLSLRMLAAITEAKPSTSLSEALLHFDKTKFLIEMLQQKTSISTNASLSIGTLLEMGILSQSVVQGVCEFACKQMNDSHVGILISCPPNFVTSAVSTEILRYILNKDSDDTPLSSQHQTVGKLQLCLLLFQLDNNDLSRDVTTWLRETALQSFCESVESACGQKGAVSNKKKKKSKVPTRGISLLLQGLGQRSTDKNTIEKCWELLRQLPAKFQGSRDAYYNFFTMVLTSGKTDLLSTLYSGSTSDFPNSTERLQTSSIASEQLTRCLINNIEKTGEEITANLFKNLIITSTVAKSETLSEKHPAYLIVKYFSELGDGEHHKINILRNLTSKLLHLTDDSEGFAGSDQNIRRIRKWWTITGLLPNVVQFESESDTSVVDEAAKIAVEELQQSHLLIPKTRVMVQNVWAICCALRPNRNNCVPRIRQILGNYKTETRLAVSTVVVAAQLLLTDAVDNINQYLNWLLQNLISWSFCMTHSVRIHAQLLLSECLNSDKCDVDLSILSQAAVFFNSNPHLSALREAVKLGSVVSLYYKRYPLPPFSTLNIETSTTKAMRFIKRKFVELEDVDKEKEKNSTPSAGWTQKGSRRCPARARGHYGGDDDDDDDDDDENSESDEQETHQRRQTSGRPVHGNTDVDKKICVIGSFLDNIPNQAGLCRTLEALFGPEAEVTLPSLKATQEPGFLRMSLASERWLKIIEVPPGERLAMYIKAKRKAGFRIVAVEQTDNSTSATDYKFSDKTVIIVGNEQMGCPAWLLRRPELVDDFVELPLDGASRSLNAHVTAAAMMWQFKLQTQKLK